MMDFYLNQKPVLEINPRHPLIKKLKENVEAGSTDVRSVFLVSVPGVGGLGGGKPLFCS